MHRRLSVQSNTVWWDRGRGNPGASLRLWRRRAIARASPRGATTAHRNHQVGPMLPMILRYHGIWPTTRSWQTFDIRPIKHIRWRRRSGCCDRQVAHDSASVSEAFARYGGTIRPVRSGLAYTEFGMVMYNKYRHSPQEFPRQREIRHHGIIGHHHGASVPEPSRFCTGRCTHE